MGSREKVKSRLKKVALILISVLATFSVCIFVFAYFFLKSPSFIRLVENKLKERLGKEVKIGAVSFSAKPGLILKDLTVKERGDGPSLVVLPWTEISVSMGGLVRRHIDYVTVREPKLFLKFGGEKEVEPEKEKGPLPFAVKRASVTGGEVNISFGENVSYLLKPIDIDLEEMPGGKAKIRVSASAPGLISDISFTAVLDPYRLEMEKGHLEMREIELKDLSSGNLAIYGGGKITGSLNVRAEMAKKEGGLELALTCLFRDVSAGKEGHFPSVSHGSGRLRTLLTLAEDYRSARVSADARLETGAGERKGEIKAGLTAAYDAGKGEIAIEEASLSSDFLGSVAMRGVLKNVPSKDIQWDLTVKAENLPVPPRFPAPSIRDREKGPLRANLGGEAVITGSPRRGITWWSEMTLTDAVISGGPLSVSLREKPLRLSSKGTYFPKDDSLRVDSLESRIPRLGSFTLNGSIARLTSGNPLLSLNIEGERVPLEEIRKILAGPYAGWLNGLEVNGQGKVRMAVTGDAASPFIQGDLSVEGKSLERGNVAIGPFEVSLPFENGDARAKITGMSLKTAAAAVSWNGKTYRTDRQISITGDLEADLDKKTVLLKPVSIAAGASEKVSAEMALSFSGPETVEATVKSGAIDLQSVRASYPGLFTPLKGLSLKGKGETSTSVKATFKEGSPAHLALETDLRFKGGGFSTADGTTVAEGINMDLSGILEIPDPTAGAIFSINAQATGFELLSGRFYGDFKEKKASLLLEGRYLKDGDTLNISRADLRLTGMGRLSLSGHVSGLTSTPGFDADVHLSDLSNRDVYGFFIRDTFKESFPILSSLQLDGVSELALSVKGSRQGFEARGNLKVLDAGLTSRDGELAVRGGAIFLPVDVSYPRATSHKEVERFGSLRFKNITWRSLKIQDFQAFPVLWGDSLHFREDVKIPLFGGSVTFKNITFSHLFSPSRKLLFATDLDDLDLEKLSSGLGIHRFRGSLSGTIPKASFSGSSVVTEGEIVIKLFGGEMRIKEISVRNVFSPVASFKSSIELKEIHLARLTETFEFGHISGILEGYVNDLVITDGQPESFEASIETVKRRGVKQRISVKALEKISILGTGSSATVLGRGIYSLFKEYNYSKMGFSGRLRNDTFLLKGIEREGDTGYLVRGGLFPPKVNVIYYTQEVSFREMVKRLKRITLAGEKEEVKTR